ncbi:uncharacterized protein LOC141850424 [Brevipalpus obovatus]|uniref:uncharacterized protein LOC141850424 n=1 Tax=Brevipalpus obovatus TaxID=246614 RepID=UPI003D9DF2A9
MFNMKFLVLITINAINVSICVTWHQRAQPLISNSLLSMGNFNENHQGPVKKLTSFPLYQRSYDKLKKFHFKNSGRQILEIYPVSKTKRPKRSIVVSQTIDEQARAKSVVSRMIGTENSKISVQYEHDHQQSNEKMDKSEVDEFALLLLSNSDLNPNFNFVRDESEKFKDQYKECQRLWTIGDKSTNTIERSGVHSSAEQIHSRENILEKFEAKAKTVREKLKKNKVDVDDQISVGKDGHVINDRKFAKGESQTDTNIDLSFLNADSRFINSQANRAVIQLRVPTISGRNDAISSMAVNSPSSTVKKREYMYSDTDPDKSLIQFCSSLLEAFTVDEKGLERTERPRQSTNLEDENIRFGSQVKIAKNGFLEDLGFLTTDQAQLSELSQDFNGEEHNSFTESKVSLARVALTVSADGLMKIEE